jgi:hypothetical protein
LCSLWLHLSRRWRVRRACQGRHEAPMRYRELQRSLAENVAHWLPRARPSSRHCDQPLHHLSTRIRECTPRSHDHSITLSMCARSSKLESSGEARQDQRRRADLSQPEVVEAWRRRRGWSRMTSHAPYRNSRPAHAHAHQARKRETDQRRSQLERHTPAPELITDSKNE